MHEFKFDSYKVRIKLPLKRHLPTEPNKGELLTFNVYREVDGKKIPQRFWAHAVDVIVLVPEQVTVAKAILNQPPNAYGVVPESHQKQLDRVAENYTSIAEKAFDLWKRTLRWKCENSAIGRPEFTGHKSGWGTALTTQSTNQRIWIWHEVIRSKGSKPVTPEIWNHVESALQSGTRPPVFVELMFDAIEHMKLGDLQRATVDMAVACESYLRTLVGNSLPAGLNESVREYVDDANIRPVLTKFVPKILKEVERKELKKLQSTLHKLFNARNDIVHKGRLAELKPDDCERFLQATRKLLTLRN